MTMHTEISKRAVLVDPQGTIMAEIADPAFKRDSVALTYAFCMADHEQVDFGAVNRAILARWSPSGLEYIKERAWKIVEGKVKP